MTMPDRHYAGDTLEFRVSVPDYPPGDGWQLRYRFIPRFTSPAQTPIDLIATNDGDEYLLSAAPSVTVGWVPGLYGWTRYVIKSGARQVLDDLDSRGQLEILADPVTVGQGHDNRTQAQKALDDANAALAAFDSTAGNVKRYSIAGREMEFHSRTALIDVRNEWQKIVNREWRREVIKRTGVDPNLMVVRFK